MRLQGTLTGMPGWETHFETTGLVRKPATLSLIMNIEESLELKIDIPWAAARAIAKAILATMDETEHELELGKPK